VAEFAAWVTSFLLSLIPADVCCSQVSAPTLPVEREEEGSKEGKKYKNNIYIIY
jgi:hypothetical protein